MYNRLLVLLLVAFCCPLQAQQAFSRGIKQHLILSAGHMFQGNGHLYVTAAYEYELGRRFSIDLKSTLDAGSRGPSLIDPSRSVTTVQYLFNNNPSGALINFRVTPEQRTLITLSPRIQLNIRQNPHNRIWFAAGPVGAYVRDVSILSIYTRINPVSGQAAESYVNELQLQQYLNWGLNGELGYQLNLNNAIFLAANTGLLLLDNYETDHPLFYATLGLGFHLGGHSKIKQ